MMMNVKDLEASMTDEMVAGSRKLEVGSSKDCVEVAPEVLGDCVLNKEDWSFFDDDIKAEMEKLKLQSSKKKRKLEVGSTKEGGDAEASTNDEMVNAKWSFKN
jgi:hypothetical protein